MVATVTAFFDLPPAQEDADKAMRRIATILYSIRDLDFIANPLPAHTARQLTFSG
jgi:hypothetical protein